MLNRTTKWPPDYVEIFGWRQRKVLEMRANPKLAYGAYEYYRTRPVEFISHWCDTYDPRNAGSSLPTKMPFVLFKRQQEYVQFLHMLVKEQENGLVEKARDLGATFGACGFSVWLWIYWDGASIGWGSRKEQLVDKLGDPDSIFEKIRVIIRGLPWFFLPEGFSPDEHMTYMRIVNPANGSTITGECGDNIGRGGRKLIYFKDESAHYEHPEMIEASLTDNTNVQVDISSVNGLGNVFHRKREAGVEWEPGKPLAKGRTNVFVMDWRDHPAKGIEWYNKRLEKAREEGLLANFYQEVDRNYAAAIDGIIIQPEWVEAAIDLAEKLKIPDAGSWGAALDVADGGGDTNAIAVRRGIVLKRCEEWGERDTGATARRAIGVCSETGKMPMELDYDCIGVGAGVKAEANRLVEVRQMPKGLQLVPWNAASSVLNPKDNVIEGDEESPLNEDFYENLKAQAWWTLARRFELAWRVMNEVGFKARADRLISIPSTLSNLHKVKKELCQAVMKRSTRTLKLVVDKNPPGTKSPNVADAIVMAYFPVPLDVIPQAVYGRYGT
jgi:hypothetical protein